MLKRKKAVLAVAYAAIITTTFLVLGEVTVRFASRSLGAYQSSPFRRYDEKLGVSLIPNVMVTHNRGCFRGIVATNRWGMRDRERNLLKVPNAVRIALIGDSYVEGAHVAPREVMNVQMEEFLIQRGLTNAEVLNFGIAGIGTTQQLLLYEQRVRRFDPDLVVLLFSDNDVMNNSLSLQKKAYGIHTFYSPYYVLNGQGQATLVPVESRALNSLWSFLESNSLLTYYFQRSWIRVRPFQDHWKGMPIEWGVYSHPPDREWAEAWQVTEHVLRMLRDEVEEDAAKLVVLLWPNFFDIDPEWEDRLGSQVGRAPADFRPTSLRKQLETITSRNGIAFDVLAPFMHEYRDIHRLEWPYFSFSCDPHPSALGHRVGGQAIIDRLDHHKLLESSST